MAVHTRTRIVNVILVVVGGSGGVGGSGAGGGTHWIEMLLNHGK